MPKKTPTELDLGEFLNTYTLARHHKPKNNPDRVKVRRILTAFHACPRFEKDGKTWRITDGQCKKCKKYMTLDKDVEGASFCPDCDPLNKVPLIFPKRWYPHLTNEDRNFLWDLAKAGNAEHNLSSLAEASFEEMEVLEALSERLGEHSAFLKLTEAWLEDEDKPKKKEDPKEGDKEDKGPKAVEEEKGADAGPNADNPDPETPTEEAVPTEG